MLLEESLRILERILGSDNTGEERETELTRRAVAWNIPAPQFIS